MFRPITRRCSLITLGGAAVSLAMIRSSSAMLAERMMMAAKSQFIVPSAVQYVSASQQYMTRTPGSVGNRKTWTFSAWVKRASVGGEGMVLLGAVGGDTYICFAGSVSGFDDGTNPANAFGVKIGGGGCSVRTNTLFTDTTNYHHFVVSMDTTNATEADRVKIYYDGSLQAVTASPYPPLNTNSDINNTAVHNMARYPQVSGAYVNGLVAEAILIDGAQLTADSFGETVGSSWVPKNPSGLTFGIDGFRVINATGNDQSGNGNNWTPVNTPTTSTDVP